MPAPAPIPQVAPVPQGQQPGFTTPPGFPPYGSQPFNIVINNAANANASAGARAGFLLPPKRHSCMVHLILFMFTAGLGNIAYWWWIAAENRRRGY